MVSLAGWFSVPACYCMYSWLQAPSKDADDVSKYYDKFLLKLEGMQVLLAKPGGCVGWEQAMGKVQGLVCVCVCMCVCARKRISCVNTMFNLHVSDVINLRHPKCTSAASFMGFNNCLTQSYWMSIFTSASMYQVFHITSQVHVHVLELLWMKVTCTFEVL